MRVVEHATVELLGQWCSGRSNATPRWDAVSSGRCRESCYGRRVAGARPTPHSPRDLGRGYWAATAKVRWNLVYCEPKTPRCHQLGELEHCKWRSLLLRNESSAEGADRARCHNTNRVINFYTWLNEHQFGIVPSSDMATDTMTDFEKVDRVRKSSTDTCLFWLPSGAYTRSFWIGIFHIGNFCCWVSFLKQLLLRNFAVDFVEICNVYIGKMIIKAANRIFNSGKICRSYSDLNFGVTFLEHSVQHDCSLHYFARSYCFRKIRPDFTGVIWNDCDM